MLPSKTLSTAAALAASMTLTMAGSAWAQGAVSPVGPGTPATEATVPGSVTDQSAGSIGGSGRNPAGVIDGTNPNPNPRRAGGILSPDAAINNEPAASIAR